MHNEGKPQTYVRFTTSYRIEHVLLIVGFGTLAITGLVQKFFQIGFSQWFIALVGGVENVRLLHRGAVALSGLQTIYHIGAVGYRVLVLRRPLTMLPTIQDAQAILGTLAYNLGLRRDRPLEGRYTFGEKMEYLAMVWGYIVMGVTGFMLWNPIASAKFLPGEIIPAAKAAHGMEAVLAVAAIIVWHFYSVHIKFFNKSMFTGKLTEEEMAHEHPLELVELKEGTERSMDAAVKIASRRQIYMPAYLLLAAFMVTGLFFFMTFEETAIETVPPLEDVEVYVPLPPTPIPTRVPVPHLADLELTWIGGVGNLFEEQCSTCHGGDLTEGGLDLGTYQSALAGGDSGPGIVPGDAHEGMIITQQATGVHDGQFSGEELAFIHDWVDAGAPER